MQNLSKKTAFTLAEIMISLFISAIIAMIFLKAIRNGTNHYMNNLLSYSAFTGLSAAAYDMAQIGCSADDLLTPTPAITPAHPYCDVPTGSQKLLPKWKHTVPDPPSAVPVTSPVTRPFRGFCDRFAREEINVTGAITCEKAAITSETGQFDDAHVNFTSTNGARFFNFGAPLNSQTAATATGFYTVYIDIDGKKRSGRMTQSASGKKDVDVIKFYIAVDASNSSVPSQVLPDPNSIAANDTDYLTASVKYLNVAGTAYTYVLTGVDYRTALCATYPAFSFTVGATTINYCAAQADYGARSQNSNCTSNTCFLELDEPGMLGVRNIFNADNK